MRGWPLTCSLVLDRVNGVANLRGLSQRQSSAEWQQSPTRPQLHVRRAFMKKKGIRASVEWSPRAGNREADAPANGVFSVFNPAHRLHCDPREPCWKVLPQALRFGSEAEESFRAAKDANALPARNVKQPRCSPTIRPASTPTRKNCGFCHTRSATCPQRSADFITLVRKLFEEIVLHVRQQAQWVLEFLCSADTSAGRAYPAAGLLLRAPCNCAAGEEQTYNTPSVYPHTQKLWGLSLALLSKQDGLKVLAAVTVRAAS